LNNAIRYTPEGGEIAIILTEKYLQFSNSAANGPLDTEKVFTRFYKDDQVSEGTGLGLAIIQQICQLAHFSINYQYQSKQHIFSIQFIA
jgi:signal transduction histidine kinase